jgi:MOSC domain-containing protein YiiM
MGGMQSSELQPSLLAVCRVHALVGDSGTMGTTAIDKRPVEGSVFVGEWGIYGDVQADREHHGGLSKAVYAYAQEDADFWAASLSREVSPGLFGENLRTSGIDVSGAVIGERWQIGDSLVLEVASPREPCGTFKRRMKETAWVSRFTAEGRPGAYLRVVVPGEITAGDSIRVSEVPAHGVTVARWFSAATAADADALRAAHESGRHPLVPEMRAALDRAIAAGR